MYQPINNLTLVSPFCMNCSVITGMLFGDTEIRYRSVNEDGKEVVTTQTLM